MIDRTRLLRRISRPGRRAATALVAGALFVSGAAAGWAQPSRQPLVPLHRLEYRELGYRFFNEIPGDSAFITALAVGGDGRIYGATSGAQSHLFAFSAATNQVKPLGTIADTQGVHHSLAVGRDGSVYIGTGKNILQRIVIKPDLSSGRDHISKDLWTQLQEHYAGYPGGHLYRYDPAKEPRTAPPGQAAAVEDLGVPVPGDGVYCLTSDPERRVLYGISYPRAHFFLHDLKAGRTVDKGPMFKDVLFGGPDDRTLRSLPRDLVVAASGDVYTSTDGGRILRFDPARQEFQTHAASIPGEAMQVVEAWARDGDVLYGGTSEGFVFRFVPASSIVENLGKPMLAQRIRGLVLGRNRMLYGLAGDRSVPNLFFRYDTEKRLFESLGGIDVDRSPYYSWRALQFDAMVAGPDGTIFMGESDRHGHLFFYLP